MKRLFHILFIAVLFSACSEDFFSQNQELYIINSRAGRLLEGTMPSSPDYMEELNPKTATLLYKERSKGEYDIQIDYVFEYTGGGKTTTSTVSFTIQNIPFTGNGKKGYTFSAEGLEGICVVNNDTNAFSDITISGTIADEENTSLKLFGKVRGHWFYLEILSVSTSADKLSPFTPFFVIAEYTVYNDITFVNTAEESCRIVFTRVNLIMEVDVETGGKYHYEEHSPNQMSFLENCTSIELSFSDGSNYSMRGIYVAHQVNGADAILFRTKFEHDWYLFKAADCTISTFPYTREEYSIINPHILN